MLGIHNLYEMNNIKIKNMKMLSLKHNGIVKSGFRIIKLVKFAKYIKMSR